MRIHKAMNNKIESQRYLAALMVVSMLVIISVTSYGIAYGMNSDGEEVVPPAVLEADGYTLIHTPQELALIGKGANYLNGKYRLGNDIVFTSADDTNDGIDIYISVVVHGNNLTVTLAPSSGSITAFFAWIGTSSADSTNNTVTLFDIPSGVCTLTVGGFADSYHFAYSVRIDTSTSGEKTSEMKFNSNGNFDPIGSESIPFTGIFDGGGYEIRGLNVSIYSSDIAYAGLFEHTYGAKIFDFGIVDGAITATSKGKGTYAGGIVCYASSSLIIENCYNTSNIIAAAEDYSAYAGGIIGYSSSIQTIENCYNTGNVSASASITSSNAYASGIAGYCYSKTVIKKCYNTGDISASVTSSPNAYAYAGGIVGYAFIHTSPSLTIENCYNTGSVYASTSAITSSHASAGGIVGYVSSSLTIENCYNSGKITATATAVTGNYNTIAYVGGIVGYASSSLTIENCYNRGNITAESEGGSYPHVRGGGIVGYAYNNTSSYFTLTIKNCYNSGRVTIITTATVNYYEFAYAGGIAGCASSLSPIIIENCYNRGNIATTGYSAYIGGIAGCASSSTSYLTLTIENCYNRGNIATTGYSAYVGGIIGLASSSSQSSTTIIKINNCHFLEGQIIHNNSQSSADILIGSTSGTIIIDSGMLRENNQGSGAKTMEQMTPTLEEARNGNSIYFIGTGGWNYGEYGVWTIVEGVNDGYPILKSLRQVVPGTPSYNVILTPGVGYTLTPEGGSSSPVDSSGSFSFTVSADPGYALNHVVRVTVNGVPWTPTEGTHADGVYTLTNITEDKTVAVVFSPIIESSYDYNGGTSVEIDGTVDPSAGATYVKVYITFSDGSVISSSFSIGSAGEFSFGYSGNMRPISYLVTAYDGKPGTSGSNMAAWTMTNEI